MKNTITILIITIIAASCTSGNPMNSETSARIIQTDKAANKTPANVIRFKVNKQDVVTSGWAISGGIK